MEPLAIYIRAHTGITGFSAGGTDHTISLFADDVIMILTEVEPSLAVAHEALFMFNRISYYKVNESKSQILGIGIDDQTKTRLQKRFPYIWSSKGIKYLGITLTEQTEQLVNANYTPFFQDLHSKLSNITKAEMTWSGRLAAFKMMILPQLIYLFRALPIPVPEIFFSRS